MSAKLIASLVFVACTATINAQSAAYVPSTDLPNGKQIVAVYFGAQSCGPCHNPDVKEAVASMKLLVGAQARVAGAMFAAIGVANDWDSRVAAEFVATNGRFDQVVLGGNFTNLAIEQFVWRDPKGVPSMPQIVIVERTVKTGDRRIEFSDARILRRVLGSDSIPLWAKQGAPIGLAVKN